MLLVACVVGSGRFKQGISSMEIDSEVQRLLELLNAEDLRPAELEFGLQEFSVESKNELVARAARTFDPPPEGRFLARLLFIMTDENRSDMQLALIANLRSPHPEARRASLYGLEQLGHPGVVDFALNALRDDSDQVLAAACSILLSRAKEDSRIRQLLHGFYKTHRGQDEFYGVTSLLEAHGVDRMGPTAP